MVSSTAHFVRIWYLGSQTMGTVLCCMMLWWYLQFASMYGVEEWQTKRIAMIIIGSRRKDWFLSFFSCFGLNINDDYPVDYPCYPTMRPVKLRPIHSEDESQIPFLVKECYADDVNVRDKEKHKTALIMANFDAHSRASTDWTRCWCKYCRQERPNSSGLCSMLWIELNVNDMKTIGVRLQYYFRQRKIRTKDKQHFCKVAEHCPQCQLSWSCRNVGREAELAATKEEDKVSM